MSELCALHMNPDSKVHGANMGPIWGRQDPGGPHVGPMNFAIWEGLSPCHTVEPVIPVPVIYFISGINCVEITGDRINAQLAWGVMAMVLPIYHFQINQ